MNDIREKLARFIHGVPSNPQTCGRGCQNPAQASDYAIADALLHNATIAMSVAEANGLQVTGSGSGSPRWEVGEWDEARLSHCHHVHDARGLVSGVTGVFFDQGRAREYADFLNSKEPK